MQLSFDFGKNEREQHLKVRCEECKALVARGKYNKARALLEEIRQEDAMRAEVVQIQIMHDHGIRL